MSLAGRKSDLKSHLSRHVVKRHLNLVTTTDLPNDAGVVKGASADGNASLASIDLGAKPSISVFVLPVGRIRLPCKLERCHGMEAEAHARATASN
jgi:hypothetical protein